MGTFQRPPDQPVPARPTGRLIRGDCLAVASALPAGAVDLLYVDPPFATGRRQRRGAGPAARSFDDRWEGGLAEYLAWLEPRLAAFHRLLAPEGGLVVHLDWRAVHHVRVALDRIFGPERFRNEIVWHYGSGGRATRTFARKHDSLLWYARGDVWRFDGEAVATPRGRCALCGEARAQWNHLKRETDADGRVSRTIRSAGRTYRYYDDAPVAPDDVWLDLPHLQQRDPERVGYPTQKPERLLRRIVLALSRPGELVADLMCGSGTTLAVAAANGRRFVGADVSAEAIEITARRLAAAGHPCPVERV